MPFDREGAKAAGYTDAEIDAYLGSKIDASVESPRAVAMEGRGPGTVRPSFAQGVSAMRNVPGVRETAHEVRNELGGALLTEAATQAGPAALAGGARLAGRLAGPAMRSPVGRALGEQITRMALRRIPFVDAGMDFLEGWGKVGKAMRPAAGEAAEVAAREVPEGRVAVRGYERAAPKPRKPATRKVLKGDFKAQRAESRAAEGRTHVSDPARPKPSTATPAPAAKPSRAMRGASGPELERRAAQLQRQPIPGTVAARAARPKSVRMNPGNVEGRLQGSLDLETEMARRGLTDVEKTLVRRKLARMLEGGIQ